MSSFHFLNQSTIFSMLNQSAIFSKLLFFMNKVDYVKSVRIRSFSGPYFLALGLNTRRYGVSPRIQYECGKIRTRKTPNEDNFYAVVSNKKSGPFTLFCQAFVFYHIFIAKELTSLLLVECIQLSQVKWNNSTLIIVIKENAPELIPNNNLELEN